MPGRKNSLGDPKLVPPAVNLKGTEIESTVGLIVPPSEVTAAAAVLLWGMSIEAH